MVKENELIHSAGYYSGDYPELAGTDDLLSIWAKLDKPARRDLLVGPWLVESGTMSN